MVLILRAQHSFSQHQGLGVGGKGLQGAWGSLSPTPPTPNFPSGSNVTQPKRVWQGLRTGSGGQGAPPHAYLKPIPTTC